VAAPVTKGPGLAIDQSKAAFSLPNMAGSMKAGSFTIPSLSKLDTCPFVSIFLTFLPTLRVLETGSVLTHFPPWKSSRSS